jgi:SAM-dependent methyltransferase
LQRFYEERETSRIYEGRASVQLGLLAGAVAGGSHPRVLDLGCGDGSLTAMAADATEGALVVGLDWSRPGLASARKQGVVVVLAGLDGEDLPFPNAVFDVVMMNEVVEHLVEIDHAIEEARRVLVPGGHLILSTPNLAAWFNRVLLLVGVQPVFSEVSRQGVFGRPGSEVVGHLRLFTRRALVQFAAAHGFTDVTVVGATFEEIPLPARPLDRLFAHWPSMAALLAARLRKPR